MSKEHRPAFFKVGFQEIVIYHFTYIPLARNAPVATSNFKKAQKCHLGRGQPCTQLKTLLWEIMGFGRQ